MKHRIVCTGRGTHKRHVFNSVDIDGTRMMINAVVVKNTPGLAGDIDGDIVEPISVARAYDPRQGKGLRWECPLCHVNARFSSEADARNWIRARGRVADISHDT